MVSHEGAADFHQLDGLVNLADHDTRPVVGRRKWLGPPRNYPYIPDVAYQRVRLVNRANSFYRHFSCRDFDVIANASNCGPFPPPNRTVNSSS